MKDILKWMLLGSALWCGPSAFGQSEKPNIIIIFCDDLGYGDLGVFGHPTIRTDNLDRMAFEGQKWTSFYAAAPVCTPSRAGLMTGRYPVRSGMASGTRRVLFPDSKGGLPASEITIATQLKKGGYYTACIGKWHLGHLPEYLPTAHGFDDYFGIPYSNDMDYVGEVADYFGRFADAESNDFNVPLQRNDIVVEQPARQESLTKRYTEAAIQVIDTHGGSGSPFFIYLAYAMPHVPLFRSDEFAGVSKRGLYGDAVEEIDWSVGQILQALKAQGLDENTLVVFSSDNGPWLVFGEQGGSSGAVSGGKGGTMEGGLRVPTIMWWPGKIAPGVVMEMGATLDLFPTLSRIANIAVPADRIYDGFDLTPTLFQSGAKHPRDVFYFYRDTSVFAVRKDAYKAHFVTQDDHGRRDVTFRAPPLLYNLEADPAESNNIAHEHPEAIATIRDALKKHENSIEQVENQLQK